jgi:uncharacterized membrane protein YphA (DoxX/SURF4 family)
MRRLVNALTHPHVALFLRLLLGGVFLYASLDKIRNPTDFAHVVLDYHFLPDRFVIPFSVLLPWVEATSGALLILGVLRRGSAAILLALLVTFVVAIGSAVARGIDIACGCFQVSGGGERVAWETLGRDLLLIVAALPVLFARRTALELARGRRAERS